MDVLPAETESGVLGPINLRIEEAFVGLLQADPLLAGLTIVAASDREITVPPLHCFVYCDLVVPQLPTGPLHKANVAVALVTNIDDHLTAVRKDWWGKILQAITRRPQEFETPQGDIIKGWVIKAQGEISSGQQTGDVARLTVGAIL